MWWLVALGLLLGMLLLFKTNIIFDVQLKKDNHHNELSIELRIGAWRFFNKNLITSDDSLKRIISTSAGHLTTDQDYRETVLKLMKNRLPNPIRMSISSYSGDYLLNKLSCQQLEWYMKIGFANPALTGLAVGGLWYLSHILVNKLIQKIGDMTTAPIVSITPDFHRATLELELNCIFAIRVGHIITAVCRNCWFMLCSFLRGEKIEQPSY